MLPKLLDGSHYQGTIDPQAIKALGISGIIEKATEIHAQSGPVDAYYAPNRVLALSAGLLWGSYLFLDPPTTDDGIAQANLYLKTAVLDGNTTLCLDLEAAGDTLAEAEACILRIHQVTGVYPILYTGAYVIARIGGYNSQILAQCPLWLADRNPTPVVPKPWHAWTILQYSTINIGRATFDLNVYNGSNDDLVRMWKTVSPVSTVTIGVPLVGINWVAAFKEPGGELHSWVPVGSAIDVDFTSKQSAGGVDYYQAVDDRWFRAENVGQAPPQPQPTTVTMWTTVALNLRKSPSTSAAIVTLMPIHAQVQVTLPATTDTYHWVAATYTDPNGNVWSGFCSSQYGATSYLTQANPH